jgi:D-psicose/D-tagatose/L-ribulose 3-epimerase
MGYDVLEIPLEDPEYLDYERTAAKLSTHNLDASIVAVMTEKRDLLHSDAAIRSETREYVREGIRAAKATGADRVVGPLYSPVGRTWHMDERERDRARARVADQLRQLADYAADLGVTLCIEPLNRFETSLLNTTEQGIELVDRVDSPACKLLLDTFHMNIEERSIPDAIRRAGDRIGHFHACGNDRGAPGKGSIDWDGVEVALTDVGYDGQVVVESFTPDVDSIARAAAIWRALAGSQDELAAESAAFLRDRFGTPVTQ